VDGDTSMKYPYNPINGELLPKEFLDSVWKHLHKKARLCHIGMDEMTPSDKLAYIVLKQVSLGNQSNEADK
jgi:hypothetical protein